MICFKPVCLTQSVSCSRQTNLIVLRVPPSLLCRLGDTSHIKYSMRKTCCTPSKVIQIKWVFSKQRSTIITCSSWVGDKFHVQAMFEARLPLKPRQRTRNVRSLFCHNSAPLPTGAFGQTDCWTYMDREDILPRPFRKAPVIQIALEAKRSISPISATIGAHGTYGMSSWRFSAVNTLLVEWNASHWMTPWVPCPCNFSIFDSDVGRNTRLSSGGKWILLDERVYDSWTAGFCFQNGPACRMFVLHIIRYFHWLTTFRDDTPSKLTGSSLQGTSLQLEKQVSSDDLRRLASSLLVTAHQHQTGEVRGENILFYIYRGYRRRGNHVPRCCPFRLACSLDCRP